MVLFAIILNVCSATPYCEPPKSMYNPRCSFGFSKSLLDTARLALCIPSNIFNWNKHGRLHSRLEYFLFIPLIIRKIDHRFRV